MFLRIPALCAMFFLFTTCFGQSGSTPQYNFLLWRISGNGLSRPSYLFGTMHIADKRVFFFSDSLYNCLEQSEGFAAELDMTNMITEYLNEMFDQNEDEEDRYLISDLDEKLLDKYKAVLEKKFKKPIGKITEKELKNEENRMRQKLFDGEMPTFMDAYLFTMAKRQGKWVGGIEDFGDQFPQLENNSIEELLDRIVADKNDVNRKLEWMIKTYLDQDLDAIDKTQAIWQGGRDSVLLRRNAKMSRRIDSLAHARSCFFAIGAAHLPGDSGVVSLLRGRGFTVTPVVSTQKIAPEQYADKKTDFPWATIFSDDSAYTIQMPSKPDSIRQFEALPFEMKANFDLGFMRFYFTMKIPVSESRKNKGDSLMNSLAARYKAKSHHFEQKDIVVGTLKGREFISTDPDETYRMQIFFTGDFVALNYIYAVKKDNLFGKDPERFFNSFSLLHKAPKAVSDSANKWKNYVFDQHAFSVSLPGEYREKKLKPNTSWYQKQYESTDVSGNGSFFAILVNEAKPGYYSDEDSAYFEKMANALKESLAITTSKTRHFLFNSFPAMEGRFELTAENEKLAMRTLMINRGNRRYYLVATYQADNIPDAIEKFFSSFAFLPVQESVWRQSQSPDHSFSLWAPSDVTADTTKGDFHVYERTTSTSIYVHKHVLPEFYWVKNDSLFFEKRIKSYVGYSDSVISSIKITNGNANGMDYLVRINDNHNLKKIRMLLNADTLYLLYGFLPDGQLKTANYEKLFNEFRFANVGTTTKLYERKPEELLHALASNDSIQFGDAVEAFNDADFEYADIPLLQRALLVKYRDFDSSYYGNLNANLLDLIEELDTIHSTVAFTRNNYKTLTGEKEHLKPFFLTYLAGVKTAESYQLLKELLTTQPVKADVAYNIRSGLYDSLGLTRMFFPELLSIVDDKNLFTTITSLATTLLDSGLIDRAMIVNYKDPIFRLAKRELAHSKNDLEQDAYKYSDLVDLLGVFNTAESNALLNRFSKISDRSLRMHVIIALLKNNQPVKQIDLFTLATSDEFRVDLLDKLKKIGKEKLFPAEYLSQKQFAQSRMYNYLNDGDEEVPTFYFIAEKTALFKGKEMKFYLYRAYYEENYYLAVAGPYSLNSKDLTSTDDAMGVDWDNVYDKSKMEQLFREYLENLEKPGAPEND